MSFLSEGLPALSVILSNAKSFGRRIARNEFFSKIGALGSLALSGYMAQRYSIFAIFYIAIFTAFAVTAVVCFTHLPKISPAIRAPGISKRDLFATFDRGFLSLMAISFLYQMANAPMFMIYEQALARSSSTQVSSIVSTGLMATQVIFIAACFAFTRLKNFKPTLSSLGIGFGFILMRGLVLASSLGLVAFAVAQIFDALAAAVLVLIPIQIIARTKAKTFNIASSFFGLVVVGGSSAGLWSAGFVLQHQGATVSFLALAGIAIVGIAALIGVQRHQGA